jgi:hypothetical protein
MEGRTVLVAALLIGGSLCVPLCISCAVLELDSPISFEQVARISRAGLFLLWSCLAIQPLAAAILRSRLFPTSTGWRKVFQFVWITAACAIVSIGTGVMIYELAEQRWLRMTLTMFG